MKQAFNEVLLKASEAIKARRLFLESVLGGEVGGAIALYLIFSFSAASMASLLPRPGS